MPIFASLALATALAGGGAVTSTDPLGAELVRALTNMGAYTQFAKECGAPKDVVTRAEASGRSAIAEMKAKSAELKIDFDRVYANGRDKGHEKYASLGAKASQSEDCAKAIEIVTQMP